MKTLTATKQQIRAKFKSLHKNEITITEWWAFLETNDRKLVVSIIEPMQDAIDRIKKFCNGFYFRSKIRSYCNMHGYSDVHPYEVVRVISDKCVEVRKMDTVQTVFPKDVRVGGFSAVTVDNWNQDYEYISNTANSVMKIRLGKKGWGNGQFNMSDRPYKHYDYNF